MLADVETPHERSIADMARPTSIHRPGAISTFFVYKAGLFAACFWGWLAYLAIRGDAITGWHFVATTGAVTTTLVAVMLGVRFALQRNAAIRHEELMENLVELSWHAFTSGGEPRQEEARPIAEPRDGDAGVIRLSQDVRQRPRR
jgi:hypothetical protein